MDWGVVVGEAVERRLDLAGFAVEADGPALSAFWSANDLEDR